MRVRSHTRVVVLTGVTGFLGKVVLNELLRGPEARIPNKIIVPIRPRRGESAASRFERCVVTSPGLSGLPIGWQRRVEVLSGDLEEPQFGLTHRDWRSLIGQATEVIHCAASVDFHSPLRQAARTNVTAALNVLELAREARAGRLVHVSTAYVTPHPGEAPIREELVRRFAPPEALRSAIESGRFDDPEAEAALLRAMGHPNTYTLTKCLAEQLIAAKRGAVPVTVVRPSIISASLHRPFPGWIDSPAAFALLAMMIAQGRLRALMARRDARIDVVPVDFVAERIVAAIAGARPRDAGFQIQHLAAGLGRSLRIDLCVERIERFFRRNRVDGGPAPRVLFIGPEGPLYGLFHLLGHWLPRRNRPLRDVVRATSRQFAYFTTRSFDFRVADPFTDPAFEPRQYLDTACAGIHRHLLVDAPGARVSRTRSSARAERASSRGSEDACAARARGMRG